jgi:hypothetical protein
MEAADDHERRIPTRADDPIPFLFWEPLEFTMAIVMFGGLMILVNPLVGAAAGGFVLWGAKKMRRGAKRGMVQHMMWAFGVMGDAGMQRFPPPTTTEFVE